MSLRLGGDGAITGCSSLAEPALTLSGITVSGVGDISGNLTVSGNLGIGVSNPTNSIEVNSLQADIRLTATGNNPADLILNSDRDPGEVCGRVRGYWNNTPVAEVNFINGEDGANEDDGHIAFRTAGAGTTFERMRIEASGDIGINTTNPTTRLHIVDGNANIVRLERTTAGNCVIEYANDTSLMYAGLATSGTGWGIKSASADIGSNPLFFVERTTYDVGINTSNPNHNLDIHSHPTSGDADLRIYNSRAGNNEDALLRLEIGGSGSNNVGSCYIYFGDSGDVNAGQLRYNHKLDMFTITVNASERMRFYSNGNVAIGHTSDTLTPRFYVKSNINGNYVAKFFNDGNASNRLGIAVQCGSDSGSGTLVQWQDGNSTNIGKVTFSGGTVNYGSFTAIHPARVPADVGTAGYPYGTLVETISISYKTNSEGQILPRGIIYNVQKTQSANSRKVLGAYSGYVEPGPDETEGEHEINVLGDGHILCNNSGGNIAVGDGICSSATAGIGQKATASPSMIIGIAQEAVTFTDSTEERLVAVQYALQQFTPWS